jgi:hypothetical protein
MCWSFGNINVREALVICTWLGRYGGSIRNLEASKSVSAKPY